MESIAVFAVLLLLGFVAGRHAERRHFADLARREREFVNRPVLSTRTVPAGLVVRDARLAVGSVVVSVDYFKRFMSVWRLLFGGELTSYAPLIERGRREALLRMRESAADANAYLNARVETATISNGDDSAVATIEVFAYATAVWTEPSVERV